MKSVVRVLAIAFAVLNHAWTSNAEGISPKGLAQLDKAGITVAEVGTLGLNSGDLRDLGVEVLDRVAILRAAARDKTTNKAPGDGLSLIQDFGFTAAYINSTRQWGKCLNVIVKYRYDSTGLENSSYLDYRDVYARAQWYAQPSDEYPMDLQWEAINNAFVTEIMGAYNITSMSSQIQVMNSITPAIDEPGNHGSTVTVGDLDPVSEPWVNNFQYDCTLATGPSK